MNLEKLYFENSSELLLTLNSDFIIQNLSYSLIDLLGEEQENIVGNSFLDFVEVGKKSDVEKFLNFARSGEKINCNWKINSEKFKPLRFRLSLRSNVGYVFKIEDPGAENTKWGKKIVNEQILQLLFNLIPFPLFVKNRQSQYVLLNQAQADLFGLKVSELTGKSDQEFIKDASELETVRASDETVFNTHKKLILKDQYFTTPNNKMFILETIKVPFINHITGEANILGISIDITERKLAESKAEKANKDRELLIKKLTEELHSSLQPFICMFEVIKSERTDPLNSNEKITDHILKVNSLISEINNYSQN